MSNCKSCKRDKRIVARGMCDACYSRWKRSNVDRSKRSNCSITDCTDYVVSHGLCDKHRQRLRKHGHTKQTRPDSWGAINKHPLGNAWSWLYRHRGIKKIAPEWQNDFLQFVADVGQRPSKKHKLFAADESKPIGPNNFIWKRSIIEKHPGEDNKTYQARFQRASRGLKKEKHKEYELKRRFGITGKQYRQMYSAQNGTCAICKKKDEHFSLAVDHCHETGKIRGLLCSQCNRGLGLFRDSKESLKAAIDYLS